MNVKIWIKCGVRMDVRRLKVIMGYVKNILLTGVRKMAVTGVEVGYGCRDG